MTQEHKELILKDISGRLPYCPIVQITLFRNEGIKSDIDLDAHVTENIWEIIDKYHALAYLRPMSSMTIEEICKIRNIIGDEFSYENGTLTLNTEDVIRIPIYKMSNLLQFMYQRHLDFNNLIPMGLALEAPKDMYNIN